MTAQAIIWIHSLAAMLFAGVALAVARLPRPAGPRGALVAALAASALWALAVAGIGARDVATLVVAGMRDLGWLAVLLLLTQPSRWRGWAFAATAATAGLAAMVAVAAELARDTVAAPVLADAALAIPMLAAAGALALAGRSRLARHAQAGGQGGRRVLLGALVLMWAVELLLQLSAWLHAVAPASLTLARGIAASGGAALVAVAAHRGGEWTLRPSRTLALRTIGIASTVAALCLIASASGIGAAIGGGRARLVQTAFAVGTGAMLLTLASTPWLRAWGKVVVAKHLFLHRYDYRVAWIRFTATLAAADDAGRPLAERVVRAMAGLTESPAGLLLLAGPDGLAPRAAWRWPEALEAPASSALAARLSVTCRIVALDEARHGAAPAEEIAAVPDWLVADRSAWALVPLIHGERLVGAIVLARPTIDRALDWEDFDLLGVAGRQVASYLAEDAAHVALGEARRFEEFNRRFAFLLHDLKNLVSQMTLVARNAERHAENPAFRADMIATLRDTSQRMSTLLVRLSQQPLVSAEPPRAVAVRALAERIADARRAQHPLRVEGGDAHALAQPAALETVLGHLVQNAIEASAPGRAVTLSVRGDAEEVTIDVADRGIGMAAAFVRDELFKPFVSGKPNGFGLGAYEARTLVEAMGGRLTVDSRPDEGTRFRIHLPSAVRPGAIGMEEAA